MPIASRSTAPVLLVALVLASCHKSSGSSPPPVQPATNNLTATSLGVATTQPRVGYPLQLVTTIQAVEDTSDVSVSYYALNGEDVANQLEQVRQFYLGTATFPSVQPAVSEYRADLSVPTSLTPGNYVIICSVDPSDLIRETDEDDNLAEIAAATTIVPLADPNVFLQELVLDRQSIVLDPDFDDVPGVVQGDVQNSDAGGTLVIGLEGSLSPVAVEAFVRLRITRTDLPPGSNTLDVPIYLWDSLAQRYLDVFGLNGPAEWLAIGEVAPAMAMESDTAVDLATAGLVSAHVDVYVPGKFAQILIQYVNTGQLPLGVPLVPDLPPAAIGALIAFLGGPPGTLPPATLGAMQFAVIADVRVADAQFVDADPADNTARRSFFVVLPDQQSGAADRPLAFESGLDSKWDSDQFGVGFGFDALAAVDGRGAVAEVIGSVPAEVFGNRFDFMTIDARAQVVPATSPPIDGETSGFFLDLEFAGLTIYSYEEPAGYVFDGTFSVTKEKSFAKQFFLGPVPVSTSGGVSGEIGYRLRANLQPTSLSSSVEPFATLGATIEAAVGIASFRAGVGGSLTLIDERFVVDVQTGLAVLAGQTFDGTAAMQVTNTLTGPNGELFLFAEYPGVKWCRRSVLGRRISYPCGVKTIRKQQNLVDWETFTKSDVLFDEALCKRVVIVNGVATFAVCQ